jgi:hypothetical protein
LFLLPDHNLDKAEQASCLEVEGLVKGQGRSEGSIEWTDYRVWDDVRVIPTSLKSEFCILSSDDSRKQPILESLCAELLESIEGLAQEEVSIQQSQKRGHLRLFIFPVIVTNAKLMVCQFKSSDVKITDGTLDLNSVTLTCVPFIRFRKSLATEFPKRIIAKSLKDAHRARERTVFVVNAEGLPDFLNGWKVDAYSGRFAIQDYTDMDY